MQKNSLFKKSVVVAVILFFISVSAFTATAYNEIEKRSLPTSNGTTFYVGGSGPGNYTSIQEAIDAASDGDTVFVYDDSSPYYEHVRIDKEIVLTGEATRTTIIDGMNSSEVLLLTANNVTVQGFTITNGTTGIQIPGDYAIIKRNIICDNYDFGISIGGFGDSAVVSENTIRDNGHQIPNTTTYGGIMLGLTASNKITSNNFLNNTLHAFFFKAFLNLWLFNYWDRPRLLPYPIFGLQAIIPPIFWVQFDFRPRLTPYIIP